MKIAFLGDIALIGKYDVTQAGQVSVFERLKWARTIIKDCDYAVANLESPLTNIVNTREAKSMHLKSNTSNICVLKYLGVDAVSLANNHVYDYGKKGLNETIRTLEENGVKYFGIGDKPLIIEKEKISIQGFCCFTANGWHYDSMPGNGRLHTLTMENVEKFLKESTADNCYPIVIPHWGEENTHYPRSEHVLIADSILKKGNCAIIGHHPHVPQGMIFNENGFCAFSLGNFLFDDCYSPRNKLRVVQTEDNKKGFALVLEIENGVLVKHEVVPYYDSETGLEYDSDGTTAINNYSEVISSLYGKPEYEHIRQEEQQKARLKRLGKRDWKWLINHLNYNSVMTVLHGQKNHSRFVEVVDSITWQSDNIPSKDIVLYVGNFGMPTTNAPGKRVYANSLLLNRCNYKVLMIGTDSSVKGSVKKIGDALYYMSFPVFGKSAGKKYFEWLKHWIECGNVQPKFIVRYGSPGLATFDKYLESYGKANNIPIIVDVVDWLNIDSGNLIFKVVKGIDTFLEKAVFNKHGEGLIAISSYLYDYYGKDYKHKIIIPPLVEKYECKKQNNKIPQIVYAGNPFRKGKQVKNVHAIKDRLDVAIMAFIVLERKGFAFDFHVIGMSKEEYLVAFPYQQEELDEAAHIFFHGRQSMEKTQEMIGKMDLSILLREKTRGTMAGFPTKVVESMSLGVPVITTDTSDLMKYIKNGVSGYIVDIDNQQKLEEQLSEIITSYQNKADEIKQRIFEDKAFVIDNYEEKFRNFVTSLTK